MNGFVTMLGSPLAQSIGWALLHLLWQGAIVAGILAATLALLSKQSANARYLAACGALVALVVLGAVTAYDVYDGSRGPGAGSRSDVSVSAPAAVTSSDLFSDSRSAVPGSRTRSLRAAAEHYLPYVVLAWMIGVLLLSVRLLAGWVRAHEIAKRNATGAAPEWQRAALRLADALQLRRAVLLLESAAVEVPTVIGWLRPVVLLPAATLTGLSTEQMEMILAHELAHIRRNDFFVNLIQAFVETLLFYHPAVWWISHRIRVERENCCDDAAIAVCGNALQYARALTRLEELRADAPHAVVAANGGSLIERIRRIAGGRAESPNAPSRFVAGAALLTVLIALLVAPSLPLRGQQKKKEEPAASAPKAPQTTVDVRAPKADEAEADDDDDDDSNEGPEVEAPEAPDAPAPSINIDLPAIVAPAVHAAVSAVPTIAPHVAIAFAPEAPGRVRVDRTHTPDDDNESDDDDREIGKDGKLTVDELIELRAVGVTPAYIDAMRSAGLGELSLHRIANMKAVGVTPEYVRDLRAAGVSFGAKDVTGMRAVGVTVDYVNQMKTAGLGELDAHQLTSMRAVGVTPEYVRDIRALGFGNVDAHHLISMRAVGVTPDYVRMLEQAGYRNLTVKQVIDLRAQGITPEFIHDLEKYRTKK